MGLLSPFLKPAFVPTPCIGVCKMNKEDVCIGCGRLRAEIAAWMELSPRRKRKVNKAAAKRLLSKVECK